jgi:DNA invertase Pin-like site-specific DNA recombinase
MLVAIYIRVSDESQVEGYSLEAQERLCRAFCTERGFNVAGVYIEEGVSGRHDRRPSFQRLLNDIKQQRISIRALIIMDLDRFMRNLRLQLNVKADLDALGVRLISLNDDIDTSTPEGIIHFQMKGMLAEWFSNQLGRKVLMGIREKVQQGRWHGPMPVGYQKGADGILEPSPDAEAVRLAFQLYATGRYSYLAVARELNALGWRIYNVQTKTRGLYNKWNLEVILKNPVYRGFVKLNDQLLPGSHPALIDEATWNKVRAIVTHNVTRHGSALRRSWSTGGGMLTEIAYCEHCNGRMTYQPSTSKSGRRYGYYRCGGNDRLTCKASGVRTDIVEAQMLDVMRRLALPPEWRAEIIAQAEASLHPNGAEAEERTKLEARKKRLARLYTDGLLTEAEYAEEVRTIQELMATLESPFVDELDVRGAAAYLADLPALLAASPIPEQRGILRGVFDRVWVTAHSICAIMPNRLYLPLASAAAKVCIPGGPGGHTPITPVLGLFLSVLSA